ncbi:hypothetical protein [Nocardioides sp.]|uniref:hypothetical protein n=1 Tax=Nocardioides sp. TaxID=35761 RepID=UPI002D7F82BA|nr:hypothetical protein [Nocardioides sp.]HET8959435.1 hypothetical protein [Nocardioides sp.]
MTTPPTRAVLSGAHELPGDTPAEIIAGADHAACVEAARSAGAHAFVAELPEGYRTPVGPGGVALTGSQRLRLAVARLLVEDPPALTFEDPTVGLDPAGEAACLPGLAALASGRDVRVADASPAVRAVAEQDAPQAPSHPEPPPDDAALPSLRRLLDPAAMAPLLGSLLVDEQVPDVRVESIRYKPGNNAVVQYAVRTGSGWHTAVAFSRAGAQLHRKRTQADNRRRAARAVDRTPARQALGYLGEVSALVQWLPLDIRLKLLADRPERLAERLNHKGIPTEPAQPELLRYWPRRRAVVRYGTHVLKVYRDQLDFKEARQALRRAAKLEAIRVPAYEGSFSARQTTVQEWLPGQSPSVWPGSSEAVGEVLAALHGDSRLQLPKVTARNLLAKAAVRADFVTRLLPDLQFEVDALLADLRLTAPDLPYVTSHGNFHAGQLLDGPSGLVVLDVDRLCRAAAAYDLASYASHVVFGRPGDTEVLEATLDSLVKGYGARPPGLEWYLSVCLLRRAAVPFRCQDEHWPQASTALATLAREVLP